MLLTRREIFCLRFHVKCHCMKVPYLPSVIQQQIVVEYWWEGSTPAAAPQISASHVMNQCNKVGDITFRAVLPLSVC